MTSKNIAIPKPFLKWAGGKRRIAPKLLELAPESMTAYIEPFVGGGALFFAMRASGYTGPALLSDVNEELVNAYRMVRGEPDALIDALRTQTDSKAQFLAARALDPAKLSPVVRAVRFIFLNKTCFNGLHRVNRSGQFNVPYDGSGRPRAICDESTLWAASAALQNTAIVCGSFERLDHDAHPGGGDFIYCDPPYIPASASSSFTGYSAGGFDDEAQLRLALLARKWARRGATVVISNADVPRARELHEGMRIESVHMARSINSKGGKRGSVGEIIAVVDAPKRERRAA